MTSSIVSPPPGGAARNFSRRILKMRPRIPDTFHSNFLSGVHGFQDNEFLLQAGYDVIVISPPGGAPEDFSWRILKDDYDFLIAFHSNFVSGMHGFRDNEVLLPNGYDVSWFLR